MFITPHTAVAIYFSARTSNPFLAFGAGFLSHFLLDMIPHGDEKIGHHLELEPERWRYMIKFSVIDLALTAILLVFFYWTQPLIDRSILIMALLGAWLPDILWIAARTWHWRILNKFWHWHSRIHDLFKTELSIPVGLSIQVVFTAVMLIIIF